MLIIEFIDEDNSTHIEPFEGMVHDGEQSAINGSLVTADEWRRVRKVLSDLPGGAGGQQVIRFEPRKA
jgi:hypothetical protein